MKDHREDIDRVINDLEFVKKALAKNNSILKFIALSRIFRRVSLALGLFIIVGAGIFYLLVLRHGGCTSVPAATRTSLIVLTAVFVSVISIYKIWGVLAGARKVRSDYTLPRLIVEVYSPQTVLVLVPFMTAIAGTSVFLAVRGWGTYIVPALAILFGLLFNALVGVFHMKELIIGGDWLILTGLLTLFMAGRLHVLPALVLTFGCGMMALFLASLVLARSDRENPRG